MSFGGTFTDSGWSASLNGSLNGQPVSTNLSGTLAGSLGSTITITNTGGGALNGSSIAVQQSTATWLYNSSISDYDEMDFLQVVVDEDPVTSEVEAREALMGAKASITNPQNIQNLILSTLLTGATSGGGWATALANALIGTLNNGINGTEGAISISNAEEQKGLFNNPIGLPFDLKPGRNSSLAVPGQMNVALLDGPMLGAGLTNSAGLIGNYDAGAGTFSGSISPVPVPEPSSSVLFILPAAIAAQGYSSTVAHKPATACPLFTGTRPKRAVRHCVFFGNR